MTIISAKPRAGSRPRLTPTIFSVGLLAFAAAKANAAVPLTTGRIGAGASQVQMSDKPFTTWGVFGSFRLGAYQERLNLIAGLDLTAYRVHTSGNAGLKDDIDGNDVLFFLGYSLAPWNIWAGVGAGQMRIYDREEPDQDKPHRSITKATELGVSYDLYRAQYAKVDTSLSWRQVTPEKSWRQDYGLNKIDNLQLEVGFQLLGW